MREQKRYTAQEMRDTAQCLHYNSPTKLTIEAATMLRQAADSEEENAKLRIDADLYKGASENWERKYMSAEARLEAVVKIAKESHISREVKHKGLRLYVEVDDLTIDLDMGEIVKSLNSIDAILRAARGEGGAE